MNQTEFHAQVATYSTGSTYEKIKKLLSFENSNKLSILDIGCGSGVLDNELASFGHRVMGIDIQAPDVLPHSWQFIEGDITQDWPVQKGFNVVLCTDVPEHMYDPAHILQEAEHVLLPNGKLVFGVPNHFDIRQRLVMLFGNGIVHWDQKKRFNENAWDYSHIRFFTLSELEDFFAKHGWHIEARQFNFMGAGIVPNFLPHVIKFLLLKLWPGLFSGKFIFVLSRENPQKRPKNIYISSTPEGF